MKKGLCVFFISFCVFISLFSVPVFAVVSVTDDLTITNETDINVLLEHVNAELLKTPICETLQYNFKVSADTSTNLTTKELVSKLQTKMIERLDGICTITPNFKTKIYSDGKVVFEVERYVSNDYSYYLKLNNLVKKASQLSTDYEKVRLLGNYFYDNGFIYASDNDVEFKEFKSSSVSNNLNSMPDSVLVRKKAICMGFANTASEYLTELGIPNFKLRGRNPENNGYHVWNVAYFEYNGKLDWYCIDYGVSIYKRDTNRLISTYKDYSKEFKYIWEDGIIEDIISAKYGSNMTLRTYENLPIAFNYLNVVDKKCLEKKFDLDTFESSFMTSKDIFNLTSYFTDKLYLCV